MFIFDSKC